jgi:hypothetical protein
MRYRSMRCTLDEMHAYEMHAYEMHAHKMHAHRSDFLNNDLCAHANSPSPEFALEIAPPIHSAHTTLGTDRRHGSSSVHT